MQKAGRKQCFTRNNDSNNCQKENGQNPIVVTSVLTIKTTGKPFIHAFYYKNNFIRTMRLKFAQELRIHAGIWNHKFKVYFSL